MDIKGLVSGLLGKITNVAAVATVPKWVWILGALIVVGIIYKIVT